MPTVVIPTVGPPSCITAILWLLSWLTGLILKILSCSFTLMLRTNFIPATAASPVRSCRCIPAMILKTSPSAATANFNKFCWWPGYPETGHALGQYWAFYRLAEYYFASHDAGAWSILDNWLAWFNTYVVADDIISSNIAPLATVTASSESSEYGQLAIKAIDGVIDGYPGDYTKEWATNGEGAGAWLTLTWNNACLVDKVVLYDRPNLNDQILSATLTFSDGSSVPVGPLNNAGAATVVTFTPRLINRMTMTVNTVKSSTANIGLAEIEVFNCTQLNRWKFPIWFGDEHPGGFIYDTNNYDPGAAASIAIGCLYIYMRNGDSRALGVAQKILADLRLNRASGDYGGFSIKATITMPG